MSRHPRFDRRRRIELHPLPDRSHLLGSIDSHPLQLPLLPLVSLCLPLTAAAVRTARAYQRSVVLMMGGHPIKLGLSRYLIDLVERGFLPHIACNGSALIHDLELALDGGTSEDVAKWLPSSQFGLWRETGRLNDIIRQGAQHHRGIGAAVGRTIKEENLPHRDLSTIGADPNCDSAALGQTSYTDFLIFARTIGDLEDGVCLIVGSAVTGPEVLLKALSMARNIARQHGQHIRHFTTAVFELTPLPEDWPTRQFTAEEAWYYNRPSKTLLCRAVADGGHSTSAATSPTIPTLWHGRVHAVATDNSASQP